jgi:hypothetical protein
MLKFIITVSVLNKHDIQICLVKYLKNCKILSHSTIRGEHLQDNMS